MRLSKKSTPTLPREGVRGKEQGAREYLEWYCPNSIIHENWSIGQNG